MTERIVDLSEEPAELCVRLSQLVIERAGHEKTLIPLCDVAVLVASHPDLHYTQSVLCGLTEAGGMFIACDSRRAPIGMLLPLDANYVQTERFIAQAHASVPTNKRLWRRIVQAKVRAQAALLREVLGDDLGLEVLARKVLSGDRSNIEAQASRRYWANVFLDPHFKRDREADDQNRLLNYGYAVLRALTARAIRAAGLRPSIGLHHHNRYNSFCLADDMMEPFRPIVDRAVFDWVKDCGPDGPIDKWAKTTVLESLTARYDLDGEARTLFDILARAASSLAAVYMGQTERLVLPEFGKDNGGRGLGLAKGHTAISEPAKQADKREAPMPAEAAPLESDS
jgi:CRISPR-associated protein Cas1